MAEEPANDCVSSLRRYAVVDAQPSLSGSEAYIHLHSASIGGAYHATEFADADAFDKRFIRETVQLSTLQNAIKRGEGFLSMLYTYRSCSKALPQPRPDQADKLDVYRKILDIMEPEVKKIRDFMAYAYEAVNIFASQIQELLQPDKKKELVSDIWLLHIIRLLDVLLRLDSLKDMKAGLNNDFSFYKRAFQQVRRDAVAAGGSSDDDNFNLYQFLSSNNVIMNGPKGVRESIRRIKGFEDVILQLVNHCADSLESNQFLLPSEKHMILRSSVMCVSLVDVEECKAQFKQFKLDRVFKLFRSNPYIPLYGDMTFNVSVVLQRCPHYNEQEWAVTTRSDAHLTKQVLLVNHVKDIRDSFTTYVARFQSVINRVRALESQRKPIDAALRSQVAEVVHQGLVLLSSWSAKVQEQCAWKYMHPTAPASSSADDADMGDASPLIGGASEYETVVRLNYTVEERAILIDVVGMIKSLERRMCSYTELLSPLLRYHVHAETQQFLQEQFRPMLQRTKKKKLAIHGLLLDLRTLAADWKYDAPPAEDPVLNGKDGGDFKVEWANRLAPPSATQLIALRSTLSTLISEKSSGMQGGFLKDKDFSSDHAKLVEEYLRNSFFFEYWLSYEDTIRTLGDVSSLWYREFFLELSKRIQFPIDSSLPWILLDDILARRTSSAQMELLLVPLDIYNDAARRALSNYQQRYLFDEIEAETNLVFDQLVFRLSEQIYAHSKIRASSMLLDKGYRDVIERHGGAGGSNGPSSAASAAATPSSSSAPQSIHQASSSGAAPPAQSHISSSSSGTSGPGGSRYGVPRARFDVLLRQRHVDLLGRSVDLNELVAQRIRSHLRDNIKNAILKFESGDLTGSVELDLLLENVRLTHGLLSEHLSLEPFEAIFNDANDSTSLVSFEGRIVRHICSELCSDIFPNWSYNMSSQRLVRSPTLGNDAEYERERAPRLQPHHLFGSRPFNAAFSDILRPFSGFLGEPHFRALLRLVGPSTLPLVFETCIMFIEDRLYNVLAPYVNQLFEAMMPNIKLQHVSKYVLAGIYGYFQMQFKDISLYPELKTGVFQVLREIGNAIVSMQLFDVFFSQCQVETYIASAPFLGLQRPPDESSELPAIPPPEQAPAVLTMWNFQRSVLSGAPASADSSPYNPRSPASASALHASALRAVAAYCPKPHFGSLLKNALERIRASLMGVREGLHGSENPTRLSAMDSSKEFYRLWSILQFIFCDFEAQQELLEREYKKEAIEFHRHPYSDWMEYGEGFFWGGSTVVYLFGQSGRFSAFNFADHVLTSSLFNNTGGEQLAKFMTTASRVREINTQIFDCMSINVDLPPSIPSLFTPPSSEDFLSDKGRVIVAQIDRNQEESDQPQRIVRGNVS